MITGFRLETQNAAAIESALISIQNAVTKQGTAEYHTLLSEEIQALIDNISLNVIQRPADVSLLDAARKELDAKVAYATGRMLPTQYNLYASAQVMLMDGCAYIKFNSSTPLYKSVLSKVKGLTAFSYDPRGSAGQEERGALWNRLMEKYTSQIPFCTAQMFPRGPIEVDPALLKFDSPLQRARVIARHNMTNQLLSMYSDGKEIPPYKLMRCMDLALEDLTQQYAKCEMQNMTAHLQTILINITTALITEAPNMESAAFPAEPK